jgi:putative transposase
VWGSDITYIRLRQGFIYLVAILDWFSRYVVAREVSVSLESAFCLAALEWALKTGRPEIFNSDQGAQFTSEVFTRRLEENGITISMDGRGRAMDNIFVERLWRSVKYEEVYLKDYEEVSEAVTNLGRYFKFYNHERAHPSLSYQTPAAIYFGKWKAAPGNEKRECYRSTDRAIVVPRRSWRKIFLWKTPRKKKGAKKKEKTNACGN